MRDSFQTFHIVIDEEIIARVDAVNEHDAAQYARDHFGEHATVTNFDGRSALD